MSQKTRHHSLCAANLLGHASPNAPLHRTAYSTLTLPALWLTSATNPENGTVSYTYNADGTLASKTDANGNAQTYTYDAYQSLAAIPDRQRTPNLRHLPERPELHSPGTKSDT